MSDVDDYGEWKTGKRITGISFSGNLFFLKVGWRSPGQWSVSCCHGTATTPARKRKAPPR